MGWRARRKAKKAAAAETPADDGFERDPFTTSDVRIVPATPSAAAPAGAADETAPTPGDTVLAELSEAFSDDAADGPGDRAGEDSADVDPSAVDPEQEGSDAPARTTIAIGGDDELPDIAYLDDALAEGEEGDEGTVFIDDDGRSDAMQPSAAGAATVDSRMRQRRIGVRRAANRRRLIWAGVVAVVVAVVVGGLALLGSSWFAVDDVTVLGQTYADSEIVDEVVADLEGTPVLLVDTGELEERLEAIPWVEGARVTTDFPNSATIELREREPVATAQAPIFDSGSWIAKAASST